MTFFFFLILMLPLTLDVCYAMDAVTFSLVMRLNSTAYYMHQIPEVLLQFPSTISTF
ncbi:hypothetical protein P280DRAFT_468636 [Massarina eburnea CBS 473.64]|uniref:Uncharacterized protein n=1 Tax=Massarina eburnea CBS 473.64 TaxID=1395130 RepID=A0A6A6S4H7_9PLEO|nr:hypothetical protein P280DRAFT_468636 [Massarina eburnea CBS 473.64]